MSDTCLALFCSVRVWHDPEESLVAGKGWKARTITDFLL